MILAWSLFESLFKFLGASSFLFSIVSSFFLLKSSLQLIKGPVYMEVGYPR